jgi:hypothetical protein
VSLVRSFAPVSLAVVIASALTPTPVNAHGPDPLFGTGTWNANQVVPYRWASGYVPPSWMAPALDAGAGDVGESRASRAATFVRSSTAPSSIAYGWLPCASYSIACVDRTGVPKSFAGMWIRAEGWVYDWGTLHWCQASASPPDGCFDAENIMLDELGHIEILGHHVNYPDNSDYTDAVVQVYSRQKPATGWNRHAFGVCDVARLQLEYALLAASTPVSSCLSLATTLALTASPTSAYGGQSVAFTAVLRVASDATNNRALSGDPLSRRSVLLQHRAPGTSAWTTVATMTSSTTTDGSYTASWPVSATEEWRALFPSPSSEGLDGSSSAAVTVTVSGCVTRCPAAVVR